MRANEFLNENEPIRFELNNNNAAQAWINRVYAKYPARWENNHVMVWGSGDDQQFAIFELIPSFSKRGAVEIKWFQAYPLRQGVGSRAIKELQAMAREDGIALTLYPWDKGQVSQAKLTKFYRGQGFKPAVKGSKNMAWTPELDEGLRVDVPNEQWLQDAIDYAKSKSPDRNGLPYMGKTTASVENVNVPLSILRRIPGMRQEQSKVRHHDLAAIRKIMSTTGKLPLHGHTGNEYKPFINVAYDGSAWVNEGNHRIMAATELGWESLPVEISYFDGGERIKDGAMYPGRIGLGNPLTESVNADCFDPEFTDTQIFDDDELIYRATVEKEHGKPLLIIKVSDVSDNDNTVGLAKFKQSKNDKGEECVVSLITSFKPEYHGRGIARNVYAYVRMLGNTIKPSKKQLAPGKAMWAAWKKSGEDKHLTHDVAEATDPKFLNFMNKTMSNRVDGPKYAEPDTRPDWIKNAPVMNMNNMPGYKRAFKFGMDILQKMDLETKQHFAQSNDKELFNYMMDLAEKKKLVPKYFVEEDLDEVTQYFDEIFHDPAMATWSWADLLRSSLGKSNLKEFAPFSNDGSDEEDEDPNIHNRDRIQGKLEQYFINNYPQLITQHLKPVAEAIVYVAGIVYAKNPTAPNFNNLPVWVNTVLTELRKQGIDTK